MVPVPVRCRIPELVHKIGKSQKWLGEVTELGRQRISDYANMRYVMSLPTAALIAHHLRCKIDDIYVWEWQQE